MARNAKGLETAISKIATLREEFWSDLHVPGSGESFNQSLEAAGRVADFIEFAELFAYDALNREESCGGHFREEHQYTKDDPEVKNGFLGEGEAKRDDENFSYVAAWGFNGVGEKASLHKEHLEFNDVKLATRSYK